MTPRSAKTKGYYVKKLDVVFSQWLRKSYADDFGMVACFTCDKVAHYKEMQNGHYVSRSHMAGRWEPQNCRVQCPRCNVFMHGNYTEYSARLVKELGPDELGRLNKLKQTIARFSIQDLKDKTAFYKNS